MNKAEAIAEIEWLRRQEHQLREEIRRKQVQLRSLRQRHQALRESLGLSGWLL